MRLPVCLTMLALFVLAAQAAQASPITWNVGGTLTSVGTSGNSGSPAVGSPFSIQAVVDSQTPDSTVGAGVDTYFGVFDSFALSIGDSVLTLDPLTSITDPGRTNFFGVARTSTFEQLQFAAALTDGVNEFAADIILDFSDVYAFPLDDLAAPLPSLATKFDHFPGTEEFQLVSPATGGDMSLAGGTVTSLSSVGPVPVPEPTTPGLFAAALGVLGLFSRLRKPGAGCAALMETGDVIATRVEQIQ